MPGRSLLNIFPMLVLKTDDMTSSVDDTSLTF